MPVGLLGIEPSPRVPKTRILPVYYSPIFEYYHSISLLTRRFLIVYKY
ncbi:MAG: hypothetical protein UU85_C0002G0030 [Candidatus Wolfebacteria bacterium GW2011_GWA2_42_10]|uniref:Uncharacterized protein n=2 Tax=Candidatus Wolfeibacteriota TaxID=1752735 RepID=A0A0G0ZU56_9BACT|nr:MAG: hypothetical protein UU38_C0003G0030 [Candidatus Wolfebacteria bacterium GW2011_GWB1_41_12]KKS25536.1 MAG: hypothetical protein UU85_C0002G0030 [Candidatus Wolfebacteria bacterium GW2011_GWA2_42_10]KKT56577.1 MAG: hypothetical protein UW50_C0001G0145 [Candidatus Wolfebacteria bacterium GW2011_GWA1_44_24]